MTSHPLDTLILPQKTTQRVLIEEIPDEQHNTKTDTPEIETDPNDNSHVLTEDGRVSPDNSGDSRVPSEDTRLSTEVARVSTEDSRLPSDKSRQSTEDGDSGISIDIIQKLAEEVGSTVIDREPLNIEQKAREFKQRAVIDFEDIDD